MGEEYNTIAKTLVGVALGGKSCHCGCGEAGINGGLCGDSATIINAVNYFAPKCDGVDACTDPFASTHEVVSGIKVSAFTLDGSEARSLTLVGI